MKFRLSYPVRSLRRVLGRGFPVKATCDQACRVKPAVAIRPRLARRLGIKVPKRLKPLQLVRIGALATRKTRPGTGIYRVRFLKGPSRKLARVTRAKVRIRSKVLDGAGWHQKTVNRWLTLKSKRPLRPGR